MTDDDPQTQLLVQDDDKDSLVQLHLMDEGLLTRVQFKEQSKFLEKSS